MPCSVWNNIGFEHVPPLSKWVSNRNSRIKIKKIGPAAPLTHSFPTTIIKNRAFPTSIVSTFSSIRSATVSLFVLFQHQQMYIHTGARFKNVQNYWFWHQWCFHVLLRPTPSSLSTVRNLYPLFHDPSSFLLLLPCPFKKKTFLLWHERQCSDMRNVKSDLTLLHTVTSQLCTSQK